MKDFKDSVLLLSNTLQIEEKGLLPFLNYLGCNLTSGTNGLIALLESLDFEKYKKSAEKLKSLSSNEKILLTQLATYLINSKISYLQLMR